MASTTSKFSVSSPNRSKTTDDLPSSSSSAMPSTLTHKDISNKGFDIPAYNSGGNKKKMNDADADTDTVDLSNQETKAKADADIKKVADQLNKSATRKNDITSGSVGPSPSPATTDAGPVVGQTKSTADYIAMGVDPVQAAMLAYSALSAAQASATQAALAKIGQIAATAAAALKLSNDLHDASISFMKNIGASVKSAAQ